MNSDLCKCYNCPKQNKDNLIDWIEWFYSSNFRYWFTFVFYIILYPLPLVLRDKGSPIDIFGEVIWFLWVLVLVSSLIVTKKYYETCVDQRVSLTKTERFVIYLILAITYTPFIGEMIYGFYTSPEDFLVFIYGNIAAIPHYALIFLVTIPMACYGSILFIKFYRFTSDKMEDINSAEQYFEKVIWIKDSLKFINWIIMVIFILLTLLTINTVPRITLMEIHTQLALIGYIPLILIYFWMVFLIKNKVGKKVKMILAKVLTPDTYSHEELNSKNYIYTLVSNESSPMYLPIKEMLIRNSLVIPSQVLIAIIVKVVEHFLPNLSAL